MENTLNKKVVFDLGDQMSFLLSTSNTFLEKNGYEIDFKYIDEFSSCLSNVFSWLFRECGIRRFQIYLDCLLENRKLFSISYWFEMKNEEIKILHGSVDRGIFYLYQSYRNENVGNGKVSLSILFSEKFSNYVFSLERSVEKIKVLNEIEKFLRSSFLISYLSISSSGVHFEIPVMFDVINCLIWRKKQKNRFKPPLTMRGALLYAMPHEKGLGIRRGARGKLLKRSL